MTLRIWNGQIYVQVVLKSIFLYEAKEDEDMDIFSIPFEMKPANESLMRLHFQCEKMVTLLHLQLHLSSFELLWLYDILIKDSVC